MIKRGRKKKYANSKIATFNIELELLQALKIKCNTSISQKVNELIKSDIYEIDTHSKIIALDKFLQVALSAIDYMTVSNYMIKINLLPF